jgi:hypothetical protein
MRLAMCRSKHSTMMTIRPELTVTPYQATACHRSASAVGRGVLFLPTRGAWGLGKGLGILNQDWCPLGVLTSSLQGIFHLVGTTLWELNFHPYRTPSCYSRRSQYGTARE